VHLDSPAAQRREEGQPLDVVHVQLGEQDVDAVQLGRGALAQPQDARACIQDEQGARAYQAARAGIDWGAYQVLQNPGGPLATCIAGGAQAPQTLTFTATYLTGFYATVECSRVGSETEGTATVNVYRITSTGCNLATPCTTAQNAPNYVNRQLQLTITRTN